MPFRNLIQERKLPSPHRAGAGVADLSGLNEVMQGLHRLLWRRATVEAVDLIQVNVGRPEPRQRALDGVEDSRPGETGLVDVFLAQDGGDELGSADVVIDTPCDNTVALGSDNDFFAWNLVLMMRERCLSPAEFPGAGNTAPSR